MPQVAALPAEIRPALVFVSRSRSNVVSDDYSPIEPSQAAELLASATSKSTLSTSDLATFLSRAPGRAVVVDCTSNQQIAESYPLFLSKGVSVITPNKKAFSGSLELWNNIQSALKQSGKRTLIYHESTVGAGLPVISTIKDLIATGDQVTKVEGVFSGTMSFLFNTFAPVDDTAEGKWSSIVAKAKEAGYTEPDPRDDLNGMDVARKCTILARLVGLQVAGPDSFPVESLIPKELESVGSANEFMEKLPQFDDSMEEYKVNAEKQGKVVRYVGNVDVLAGKVNVGLQMVEKGGPIASLKGSDNLICFYTKRYGSNPLVVQGAGAGGEVTAMGVTADLIKAIERLQ